MEDGVNGDPTRLVHERVEEEFSGDQELVQIHGILETATMHVLKRLRLFCNHVIHHNSNEWDIIIPLYYMASILRAL